jgi:hypothetical protein
MATRYWTGAVNSGTGTWDTSNTANWSASSGGAGGASAPVAGDSVVFDASSGAGVCTLGSDVTCWALFMTGHTGTLAFSTFKITLTRSSTTILSLSSTTTFTGLKRIDLDGSPASGTRTLSGLPSEANALDIYVLNGTDTIAGGFRFRDLNFTGFSGSFFGDNQAICGDLTLSSTMATTGSSPVYFASTSATPRKITSNGVTLSFPVVFDGVGGTWQLQDNLTISSLRYIQLGNGTLDANGNNVTVGSFLAWNGTKTLIMGSGVFTMTASVGVIQAVWDAQSRVTGLTIDAGTSTIKMSSASAKTFAGGGKTYYTLEQAGAGALTIQQSNTFNSITNTVQPATITFTAGTTQTVTNFGVSGTSGNTITLNSSTAGSRATISRASGLTNVSYVDVKDISATGVAFYSYLFNGNVDSGNNTGIRFNLPDTSFIPSLFI